MQRIILACVVLTSIGSAGAQTPGELVTQTKIADLEPAAQDFHGAALAAVGDFDGDGVGDLAAGHPGGLQVVLLQSNGDVKAELTIEPPAGSDVSFGGSVVRIGDLDDDGVVELAVGAPSAAGVGAVWVLSVQPDGSVIHVQEIGAGLGGFSGVLEDGAQFGSALASLGDLDGDGVEDLAVGARGGHSAGGAVTGAVWILFLAPEGTVRDALEIATGKGGFEGELEEGNAFGSALVPLGEGKLVVGVPRRTTDWALWLLYLESDGTVVAAHDLISPSSPVLQYVAKGDGLGAALADLGDLDGNGFRDLAVGAPGDDDGGPGRGSLWVMLLEEGDLLGEALLISALHGGFGGELHDGDALGSSLASLGDADGDGLLLLAAGAPGDDESAADHGAAWMLYLRGESGTGSFTPVVSALDGRPGRAGLLFVPVLPGAEDPTDEPVVVTPDLDGASFVAHGFQGSLEGTPFKVFGEFPSGQGPGQALTADVDGGGMDVITTDKQGSSISLMSGQGDGSFAAPASTPLPFDGAPVAAAAGDLDGDGDEDLVVAGDAGVTVLANDGAGHWSPLGFTPVVLLTDLGLADLDGDGDRDVVATSGAAAGARGSEQGFATVLLNDGAGQLDAAGSFATGAAVASVLLARFDEDADLDALLAVHAFAAGPLGEPQGSLELFVNDGSGVFAPSPVFGGLQVPDAAGIHPTYGVVGDIDGDGRLDAVYASSDNISHPPLAFGDTEPPLVLTVLRGDGRGSFETSQVGTGFVGRGIAPVLVDVAPTDVDGDPDGQLDCLLIWYVDALGGLETAPDGADPQAFLALLVGDGTGEFALLDPTTFATGSEPADLAVADLDGATEGLSSGIDYVVPNMGDDTLAVVLGDGHGGALDSLVYEDVDGLDPELDLPHDGGQEWVGGPDEALVADLQPDGLADVVVSSVWEDVSTVAVIQRVRAYVGDGAGGLVSTDYLVFAHGGEVALADVTGGPAPDLVVTQHRGAGAPQTLLVHRGLGNGRFDQPVVVPAPAGHVLSGGLATADLDGDGRDEMLSSTLDGAGQGGVFVVELGFGGVELQHHALAASWPAVRSIDVGDLDGDGRLDVAIGVETGELVAALDDGTGSLLLMPLNSAAAEAGGGALRLADLDADGRLDLVSSKSVGPDGEPLALVHVLAGRDDGSFDVQPLLGVSSVGATGARRPVVADVNGDGALDIVLGHGDAGTVSVVLSALATWEVYGPGKPGSGGLLPSLVGKGPTVPGSQVGIELTQGLARAPGLLLIGTGPTTSGWLALDTILAQLPLLLSVAGQASFDFVLPDDGALVGLELALQALVYDEGAGPPGPVHIAASPGLSFTVLE